MTPPPKHRRPPPEAASPHVCPWTGLRARLQGRAGRRSRGLLGPLLTSLMWSWSPSLRGGTRCPSKHKPWARVRGTPQVESMLRFTKLFQTSPALGLTATTPHTTPPHQEQRDPGTLRASRKSQDSNQICCFQHLHLLNNEWMPLSQHAHFLES